MKGHFNPYNDVSLKDQIARQNKFAWDLDSNIPWNASINFEKSLVPLDEKNLFFPSISSEQQLVLSQFMGLLINATIAEMESAILTLKKVGWKDLLSNHSVNPEIWELGELFFDEEIKHSKAFYRYNELFSKQLGLDHSDLDQLLPHMGGSVFLNAINANSRAGGHALWWIIAAVEEVSIKVFDALRNSQSNLDPLYFTLHRLHAEEESRHYNYAFLMLDIAKNNGNGFSKFAHDKSGLLYGQLFTLNWMISELTRFFKVKEIAHRHPFFATLNSIIPKMKTGSPSEFLTCLFVTCPYISWVLNVYHNPKTAFWIEKTNPWRLPMRKPNH